MYLVNRQHKKVFFRTLCHFMSSSTKSHYDVLNLPRSCTDKQIKDAFIRLSKKLHPDRNKDSDTHDAFVRVVEAYSVLGKPHLRAQYDVTPTYTAGRTWTPHADAAGNHGRSRPHTFYTDYSEAYSDRARSSYSAGGSSAPRTRNHMPVVLACVGITCVWFVMQLFVITLSVRHRRRREDAVSKAASEHLAKVRAAAVLSSNQETAEMMLQKIADGASASVSTAALAETVQGDPK